MNSKFILKDNITMLKDNKFFVLILVITLLCVGLYTTYVVYKKNTAINESTKSIFADSDDKNISNYTDLNGNTVSLEQYLGKVLVATTWASWSPFSKDDLITLSQVASEQDLNKVTFIAINRKETKEQAQRYFSTLPELNSIIVVLDNADHFYTSIGGYAMPETIIYDQRGNVKKHIHGAVSHDELKSTINEMLK